MGRSATKWIGVLLTVASVGLVACNNRKPKDNGGEMKSIHLPMRSDGPKSLDPVRGSTVYDNRAVTQIYDTLLQYKYLVRPLELEPLVLESMPTVSEDGLTYAFKLRDDVYFQDDPCFEGGKGRKMTSTDVFYSWKRMADNSNQPKSWWLLKGLIVGFDDYRDAQNKAHAKTGKFDYDAPVAGFKVINDREFEVTLTEPAHRFMWILAMFQTSVVPREAVEMYGVKFGRHPVGSGPFLLKDESDWTPGKKMTLHRNPNYREEYYPTEHMPEDVAAGFVPDKPQKLPIVDRIEMTMYVQEQPMWLEFQANKLGYTQVPDEYQDEAFTRRTLKVRPELAKRGVIGHHTKLLDFIFRGINMEDELLGGYTEKDKALRQAISLASDLDEFNETFYHGVNLVYDGVIPPGLNGHFSRDLKEGKFSGPDLERARALLAKAGYPNGEGLPAIKYYVSQSGNSPEQAELMARQLEKIGVKLDVQVVTFSTMIEAVTVKKAPMFSFAWSSDYPDGENNLAIFYGPNEAPGSNHFNYKNAEYDRLYEQIRSMAPSPERTKIMEQMNRMLIEDVPYVGSMARTRHYVVNPWLKNFKPTEDFYNWIKYLDVDESKR